jgi:hypothetical protein
LGPFGLAAVVYLGIIFSRLSERLNAVAKKGDYSHWFDVANALIGVSAMSQAVRNAASLAPDRAMPLLLEPGFALLTFHIPLALGATINLVLVWYYWGWILKNKSD